MNSKKKEHREAQLAKKAEKIKEFASDVEVISDTELTIDGHPYELVKNYRDGFQVEKLEERFSNILTKYDYILGDWGYDQLRLRGFYKSGSDYGGQSQNIDHVQDYLYEYCNFGCAYFILHNLDVQHPKKVSTRRRRRRRGSSNRRSKRKNVQYEIHEKKSRKRKSKPVFHRSKHEKRKGEFTIRQKK